LKSNRHAKIPKDKKTQKCFQQSCMQPNHRTNFACALPPAWQTSSRKAILWLLNTSHKTELFRTLGGTFSSLHLWIYSSALQIWFFLFIPCFSLCCEPLGESWGKDSKLLCSICVFTLSLGRNAHNFFKFKKVSRLQWCCMENKNCNCYSSLRLRHFTCFSLWTHKRPGTSCHLPSGLTSVSHRKCTNVIAIATCQPFWIELCLAFRLCDQLINWIAWEQHRCREGQCLETWRVCRQQHQNHNWSAACLHSVQGKKIIWMSWIMFETFCMQYAHTWILGEIILLPTPRCLDQKLRQERESAVAGQANASDSGGGKGEGKHSSGKCKWRSSAVFK
jgi:hypothetical protein